MNSFKKHFAVYHLHIPYFFKETSKMGIKNMIETIKMIHKEDISLLKIGTFYTAYGKDSYIINYLFNYKLNKTQDMYSAAFPVASLGKVLAVLEKNKINYIIIDKRNNYDVDQEYNNKNLNKYKKFLELAKSKVNCERRIEDIVEYLKENVETIEEVEKIIYERRKVQSN